tara:strand:+ start:979 stop:1173 length:195 start_codon:yes stop_codon:yes gene_type:complete
LNLFNIKYFYSSVWPALALAFPFAKGQHSAWDKDSCGGGGMTAIGIALCPMATPMYAEATGWTL